MENKKHLDELNEDTLKKLEVYMQAKHPVAGEHREKINMAKDKWQAAWNEFLETLVVLEKLEI
ncbi:MAG: hypothetical protein ABIN25_13990 [Ginsengibacter sp.]